MTDRSPLDPDPLSEVPLDAGERAELLEKLADHARPLIAQLSEEQREAAQELWERLRTQTTVASFKREAAAFLDALEDPKRLLTRPKAHSSQAELRPSTDDSGALDPQAATEAKKEGQSFSEETARVEPPEGEDGTPDREESPSEKAPQPDGDDGPSTRKPLLVGMAAVIVGLVAFGVIYLAVLREDLPECVSFSPPRCYNKTLVDADLSGWDLSGGTFSFSNLSGANLSGANLSGALLGVVNLSGANLSGANLKGASLSYNWAHRPQYWVGATCPNGRKVPEDQPYCGETWGK